MDTRAWLRECSGYPAPMGPKTSANGLTPPFPRPRMLTPMGTDPQNAAFSARFGGEVVVRPVLVPSLIIGELLLVNSAYREDQTH